MIQVRYRSDVYARRYSYDGTPLGGDFKVNTDVTNSKQENSVIATDEEGIRVEVEQIGGKLFNKRFSRSK